jgi:hypothetical protein
MIPLKDPLNLELINITKSLLLVYREINSLKIFDTNTNNFDDNGLFSTKTFGRVGSDERIELFGYIDLKIPIMHPLIYREITSLVPLAETIMNGKTYAIFNEKTNRFEISNVEDGNTGFDFFMEHYDKLDIERTNSTKRDDRIDLIKRYKGSEVISQYYLVLPAGLRDFTMTDGKPSEDKINDFYRKMMTFSSYIGNYNLKDKLSSIAIDPVRYNLNKTSLEIYNYLSNLLDGKSGFVQSKWTKRAVVDGTMNVITAYPVSIDNLNNENIVSYNDTVVGLYQWLKVFLPYTKYALKDKFLNKIFSNMDNTAILINPKTLETEQTEVSNKTREQWMSSDGIAHLVSKVFNPDIMGSDIIVEGKYLCLIYDDGETLATVFNKDYLPDEFKYKYLRPIKYCELFYLSIYDKIKEFPAIVSRYPVAGQGGVYPSNLYLKTTVKSRKINYLINGYDNDSFITLYEYPKNGEAFFNTMSPHPTKISRLGADYDGDRMTMTGLTTSESIKEVEKILSSSAYYLNTSHELIFSGFDDILEFTVKTLMKG